MTSLRRIACVDMPELPLQILLRAHPEYRGAPVAVVAEERPEAPLLLINRAARELRLRTGMRFGAAKSLVPTLRAGAVSALLVEETVTSLVKDLQTFSPHVERDPVSAGVFYVDPAGLSHLYGGELSWARCLHRYLIGRSFYTSVVVGYGRTLCHALARTSRGARAVESAEETLRLACEVPLDRLAINPKLRDALERLGLTTLGDLSGFPSDALGTRFGREASLWCRIARGEEVLPLAPEAHAEVLRREVEIDPPDDDVARLCFGVKRALDQLIEDVRQRGKSVRALWMHLHLERTSPKAQRLEPSTPTRDTQLLLELLRLRLTALSLESRVERIVLEAEPSDVVTGQLGMFVPRRDLSAAERSLARIKASFGADVVSKLSEEDAHLPEAKFRFVDVAHLSLPKAECFTRADAEAPLVRRLLNKPIPFFAELCEREGKLVLCSFPPSMATPLAELSVKIEAHASFRLEWDLCGPYRVSGGWWVKEVERDYYYAHRESGGERLWVFYDKPRASWFLHGIVD